MANAMFMDRGILFSQAGTLELPTTRGPIVMNHLQALSSGRLPTDPTGTYTLTMTNIVVGSIWQLEVVTTGEVIDVGTAATSSINSTIPVYSSGSAKNDVRIKVRKASGAPYYQPYETQVSITAGAASSIFVNQVRDDQ